MILSLGISCSNLRNCWYLENILSKHDKIWESCGSRKHGLLLRPYTKSKLQTFVLIFTRIVVCFCDILTSIYFLYNLLYLIWTFENLIKSHFVREFWFITEHFLASRKKMRCILNRSIIWRRVTYRRINTSKLKKLVAKQKIWEHSDIRWYFWKLRFLLNKYWLQSKSKDLEKS